MASDRHFRQGEALELRLTLPGDGRELSIIGEVVHVLTRKAPKGTGAGLGFRTLDRKTQKAFAVYFSNLATTAHKDRSPRDTIEHARKLLKQIGIFPIERAWYSFRIDKNDFYTRED